MDEKELLVYQVKSDFQRAINAVEDALNNMKTACALGVIDLEQVQEFGYKAENILGDSLKGIDKVVEWNKLGV